MNAAITRFIDEFADTRFNHSDHLIDGLRSGMIELHVASEESRLPASHYLHIWGHRLKRLDERFGSRHTEHTQSLRRDIADLCDGLWDHPDECCDLWDFTEEPYWNYSVFISRESRAVLGCLRCVDNRLVTPEIRAQLWGNGEPRH